MQVRASGSASTTLITNDLPFGDILTDFDNKVVKVPVDRGYIVPMINLHGPAKARPFPAGPDHLATISSHHRRTIACREINASMWFPAATPLLVLRVSKYLRNDCPLQRPLHRACTHDTAGRY